MITTAGWWGNPQREKLENNTATIQAKVISKALQWAAESEAIFEAQKQRSSIV
ncbi:hypothetical protein BDV29DRAFT_178637 [Aspergillus leporis]|uniref:Uncharacterized protein n=1 Tax=Aspergillus leporis TaxID=41062 RepID=A0A5N5WT99_9EURO|nr:hypothetical protein BDV29DRAFT_178637 [Aspergillus leporis]